MNSPGGIILGGTMKKPKMPVVLFVCLLIYFNTPAWADTVSQLNITGGSIQMNLGLLGNVSGSFTQDGALVMGQYQPPPNIFPPITVDGHTFSIFTSPVPGSLPAPYGETNGTSMTVNLASLYAGIAGPEINGTLNIGGLATGNYDPNTGAFSISWTHVYDALAYASYSLDGNANVAPVPLPAAVWLFVAGFLCIMGLMRQFSV
jgi:hypothetical protein